MHDFLNDESLTLPSEIVADGILKLILLFFRENNTCHLCESPAKQTIHIKWCLIFSEKKKKNKKKTAVAVVRALKAIILKQDFQLS